MSARERLLAALAASPEVRPGEAEQKVADALAERDAQIIAWLGKKAHEYEGRSGPRAESASDVLARMASKIARGAVRPPTTAGQAPAPVAGTCGLREGEPRSGTSPCVMAAGHGGDHHQDKWTNRWPVSKTEPAPQPETARDAVTVIPGPDTASGPYVTLLVQEGTVSVAPELPLSRAAVLADELRAAVAEAGKDSCPAESTELDVPASALPQLVLTCPMCGAKPGAPCTSHGGTRTRRYDTHQARRTAWEAKDGDAR